MGSRRLVRAVSLLLAGVAAGATLLAQPGLPRLLMDGHVHITNRVYFEGIDPWKAQPVGPWDFARARQAGVNVIVENIAPYGFNTYNNTVKQTGRLIETFHRMLAANRDRMELALSAADVRRIVASGKLAVILGIEAGFDQDGDVDILRLWHRLGVRTIQFASQVTTAYADSAVRGDAKWGGINERGRQLVAEMNRLGIVIDVTHATEAAQRQIIEASRAPVVASHVGIRGVCNSANSVSDDLVRAIAAKGGLVGIHASAAVVSCRYLEWTRSHDPIKVNGITLNDVTRAELPRTRPPEGDFGTYAEALDAHMRGLWRTLHATPWKDAADAESLVPQVDEWVDHVEHVVKTAGADHVAVGLDLVHGRSSLKDFDAGGYGRLSDALRKRNISMQTLAENWLRVLDRAKVP